MPPPQLGQVKGQPPLPPLLLLLHPHYCTDCWVSVVDVHQQGSWEGEEEQQTGSRAEQGLAMWLAGLGKEGGEDEEGPN